LFYPQKGIFGLEEIPNAPRRIGPQGNVGFDLAAFFFGGLDDRVIGGWNRRDDNPIDR
jgi:hypothetical protein